MTIDVPKWQLSGDWFDVCKCNMPCPCEFAQAPSYGDCDGVLAYHIKKGQYGQISLDALNMIFTGKAGGFMAEFAKLIGEVRGIEFAPIKFEIAEDLAYWSAEIPGKVSAKAEALTGPMTPPGKRVQTVNPPGSEVGPGAVATWGIAVTDEVNVPAFRYEWKRSGRSSKHIAFNWIGP